MNSNTFYGGFYTYGRDSKRCTFSSRECFLPAVLFDFVVSFSLPFAS